MKYRVTVLTPMLAGDGQRLAPIDYMVWKDQVNVLDQTRIFRMLAKGPRLDGYLQQIRRADKLDFNQWGGYAQSYALRRVPFESAACTPAWQAANSQDLFIPTFLRNTQGCYLPGSVIKGALRALITQASVTQPMLEEVAAKGLRRPGQAVEERALGGRGSDRLRLVSFSDSRSIPAEQIRVYHLKTASLARKGNDLALAWKPAPRFAEMAVPGTVFEGTFEPHEFLAQHSVSDQLRWPRNFGLQALLDKAREASTQLLQRHLRYATLTGLRQVANSIESIQQRTAEPYSLILQMGWGTGMLAKTATQDPGSGIHRTMLENTPYQNSLKSGLPFPKTRRVVLSTGEPAWLPGLVLLQLES